MSVSATILPGTMIGVWEVECKLGRGGMGSVYRCRNTHAHRITSAIKLLDPAFQYHPEAKERFLREAEILFAIHHPNVVTVSNVHLDSTPPYLEMEFVDGVSLESKLAKGPPPLETTLKWARELALALGHIHGLGIFHRDIKPDNILIRRDGQLKLVDFGLAVETGGRQITQQGQARFGTVSYCPPEWMSKDALDPAAWDTYSLGVVLYELLLGEVAFPFSPDRPERLQVLQVVTQKASMKCLDPGPQVQPTLRDLVCRLTARDPAARPTSMADVADTLAGLDPEWRTSTVPNMPRTLTPITEGDASPAAEHTPARAPDLVEPAQASTLAARGGSWAALLFGATALCVLAFLGMGLGFLYTWNPPPAARTVELVATGVDPTWPFTATIGDQASERATGLRRIFSDVPVGKGTVFWAVGEGCTPDTTSPVCIAGTSEIDIRPGEGTQSLVVDLEVPLLQDVWVHVASGPGTVRVADRESAIDDDGFAAFPATRPGHYAVRVWLGECEDGCTDCGASCATTTVPLAVPAQGEAEVLEVDLAVPKAPEPEPVVAPPSTTPRPVARPRPIPQRVDKVLSYSDASDYCANRGGLLKVGAKPHSWSQMPMHEWRTGPAGEPMWRRMDGVVSSKVDLNVAHAHTGFRCAR